MRNTPLMTFVAVGLVRLAVASSLCAEGKPCVEGRFQGRIAYSCDGNHNDPDDWIASPVTLAILAESGVKDRLVHFDYNCILPQTNPEWEKTHAASVLGAAERYGFDRSLFFDCRKNLDAAVASVAKAINDSSAENPLYFVVAGPMEVPHRGIQKSDPAKRQFVYCVSHSRWNDGFASKYKFTFTKRRVIEQDVHWVQTGDQNRLLSLGRYGRPSPPEEFQPYFWMRDSRDPKVRFLWERMVVSTRPDPSDAGMAYFLVTGDEECDPAKLKRLLEDRRPLPPITARRRVRIEAENFRHFDGFVLEDRNDRNASHRLNVKLANGTIGRVRTGFDEPFTSDAGRYDVDVRCLDEPGGRSRFRFFVNGVPAGAEWRASKADGKWVTHTIAGVPIKRGDELAVGVQAEGNAAVRLDYVQLNVAPAQPASATHDAFPPPESQGGWRKLANPDDVRRLARTDPARLGELREWLLASDKRNFAAVVIRNGYMVLEVERGNSAVTDARNVKSCAKAICATVLAVASQRSQEGRAPKRMTFDDPAFDYIPWASPLSDPRKATITVKQLLNHTSGLPPESTGARNSGPWEYVLGRGGDSKTAKLAFEPGSDLGYSTHGLYHASLVCENVTGKPYDEFAVENLFRPLGIETWWFEYFTGGEKYGKHPSHTLGLPAREMARIAYCMLRGGQWDGRQVIPRWFVEQTACPTHAVKGIKSFGRDAESFSHGWELPGLLSGERGKGIPRDARFKPGSGGQLIAFVPSLDLVVARQTGSSGDWAYEEYLRRACEAVLPDAK